MIRILLMTHSLSVCQFVSISIFVSLCVFGSLSLINCMFIFLFFKWANPGLFYVYFRPFLIPIWIIISIIQIEKLVDGVLGIRIWGRCMVGADDTTELLLPPMFISLYVSNHLFISFYLSIFLCIYQSINLSLCLTLKFFLSHTNKQNKHKHFPLLLDLVSLSEWVFLF